jgi:hypothetical protein
MATYKNQHFVQKAYLEGFAAKGLPKEWQHTPAIWVLRKDTGKIRLQSIEKTAARSYYYSFKDKDGNLDPRIEKWFNPVEDAFPRMRQHVRDLITEINLTGNASNLDPQYKQALAEYVYIHMIRVPSTFDQMRDQAIDYQKTASTEDGVPYDENRAQILALRALIGIGQGPGNDIVENLMKRSIDIEFFPRTRVSIATNDAPVMPYDETRPAGIAYQTTSVFFPLESCIMLRFGQFGDDIRMLKRRQIDDYAPLNELVGTKADKEVYCNSAKTLEEIGRMLGLETTIEIGGDKGRTH